MLRKCLKWAKGLLITWAILCAVAFVGGFLITFLGAPRWLPLPWSDFTDFVESADGKVFVDVGFYSRVLCYGHDGRFIASYPYPFGNAKDTELAASADGRLFFRTQHLLYVYDSTWHQRSEFEGEFRSARNWALDEQGQPVFVPGDERDVPTVNTLAKPRDRIFAEEHRRERFVCADGTTLVRQGNRLVRSSATGTILTTYQTPAVLRPFTFPWPAVVAWPLFILYGIVTARRKRIGQPTITAANHSLQRHS